MAISSSLITYNYEIPVSKVLRPHTTDVISSLLNPEKVIPIEIFDEATNQPKKYTRNWHGLFELAGLNPVFLPDVREQRDKTSEVIKRWIQKDGNSASIQRLLDFLEKLDRFDVIDDVTPLINEDIDVFNKKVIYEQEESRNNIVDEVSLLTRDDTPGALQKYDAYVLFDDNDLDEVRVLVQKLESEHDLRLYLKDRDLLTGTCEFSATLSIISERCDKIIVFLTDAFLKNDALNNFFAQYATAHGIKHGIRKLIPCTIDRLQQVPHYLSSFFILDKNKCQKFNRDFYRELAISISPKPMNGHVSRPAVHNVSDDSKKQMENDSTVTTAISSNSSHADLLKQLEQVSIPTTEIIAVTDTDSSSNISKSKGGAKNKSGKQIGLLRKLKIAYKSKSKVKPA